MDWNKLIATMNDLIRSQGLTIVVVLLISGYLLHDKQMTDQYTRTELHSLREQVDELQEWRVNHLKIDKQLLIDRLNENTEILKRVNQKLKK